MKEFFSDFTSSVNPELLELSYDKELVKEYYVGEPEQRWSGSSVFQPVVRGRSFSAQLPMGVGHPVLYTFAKIDRRGNSLQSQRTNIFSNRGWKTAHGWCMIEMTISCIVKYLRKLRSLTEVPGQKFLEYCARSSCWSSRTANDQLVSTCHLFPWARDTCSWIWDSHSWA